NVVGSGLVLNSQIDYGFLGMTPEEAMVWEANTEREFALWSDTQECDASRMMTFGQMQSLVLISALMNGDAFAALPVVKRAGSIYDLRVLLIEADRICNPSIVPQGKDVKQIGRASCRETGNVTGVQTCALPIFRHSRV